MNIGQKSFVVFASRFGSSAVGFAAMVYIARHLGSEVLGVYFLVITVVSWLKLGCDMGIKISITKRISEGKDKSEHAIAGLTLVTGAFLIVSIGVFIFSESFNRYLGAPLYHYVILILGARVAHMYIGAVVRGENLVHLEGILKLINTILTRGSQIFLATFLGLGTVGILIGEIVGFALVSILGAILMLTLYEQSPPLTIPKKDQFRNLIDFAKFSWMGMVRGGTYNRMDTAVLGFFVPNSLIGIYSICWNVSAVLTLFSKSLLGAFFPEMSQLSETGGRKEIVSHLEDALSYTGLLVIPGFVGATIIGRDILSIYGADFPQGYPILVILVAAALFQSYYLQLINTMDALDRPDLSFRVNLIFVVSNIILNFTLIHFFGWSGAAFATLLSTAVAMVISFRMLLDLLDFSIPRRQIGCQIFSAIVMGIIVQSFNWALSSIGIDTQGLISVLASVALGGVVYFFILLTISNSFRITVSRNLPISELI